MSINIHNIQRWYNMLTGNSVWHVNQDLGKCFAKESIKGYYNNLTEKVTKTPELLLSNELPKLNLERGRFVYFPVAIFQYGLGAYDLYILTEDEKYYQKFLQCADWALKHQDEKGRWSNFFYIYPDTPFGAMAQGEGTSLLVRAYLCTKNIYYLTAAKAGVDYMLKSLEDGGVTEYSEGDIVLREYTNMQTVLNGWIFAWWGLYDYVLVTKDNTLYKKLLDKSLESLIKYLPKFKCFYWSLYSLDGKLASPFYHNLHIAQMQAMSQLTDNPIFNDYALRWAKQQRNVFCKSFAFVIKAFQKILER